MTFQFVPRQMGVALPKNPYHEPQPLPDCPPRGLTPGDVVELYYPMVGGDREPVPEAWVRYVVEDVSATDQITLMPCEPTPRFFAFYLFDGLDPNDLPQEYLDRLTGERFRLVHRPGRPPAYLAERGSIMRKSLDKSLQEGTDWRRVNAQPIIESAA